MSLGVLVAVEHHLEAGLVTGLETASGVAIARRCADAAELLSAAAAGLADVAVVSAGFRGMERETLRALAGHGVAMIGLVPPDDEQAERRLRQLGVSAVVLAGAAAEQLEAAFAGLGREAGAAGRARTENAAHVLLAPDTPAGDVSAGDGGLVADARRGESSGGPPGPGMENGAGVSTARVTAFWGPTGAPGRSTLAAGVACLLAARGISTLLVDLDTWGASVAQLLGLVDEAPGLAAAARAAEQGTLDVASLARITPEALPRLRVLTGLPAPERWPEARAGAVEDILEVARRLADHVVVDCGFAVETDEELSYDTVAPRRNATTLTALERADDVVVVGAADPVGLGRLVRGVTALAAVPSPRPVVVINKLRAAVAGSHPERSISEVLARFAGLDEVFFVPWAPEECDAALLAGRSVTELAPTGAVARALGELLPVLHPDLTGVRQPARSRVRLRLRPRRA